MCCCCLLRACRRLAAELPNGEFEPNLAPPPHVQYHDIATTLGRLFGEMDLVGVSGDCRKVLEMLDSRSRRSQVEETGRGVWAYVRREMFSEVIGLLREPKLRGWPLVIRVFVATRYPRVHGDSGTDQSRERDRRECEAETQSKLSRPKAAEPYRDGAAGSTAGANCGLKVRSLFGSTKSNSWLRPHVRPPILRCSGKPGRSMVVMIWSCSVEFEEMVSVTGGFTGRSTRVDPCWEHRRQATAELQQA